MSIKGVLRRKFCIAGLFVTTLILAVFISASVGFAASALSTKKKPLETEKTLPSRTPPILEIGSDFLGTGNLDSGIELPTGAIWQPALWVYGSLRSGINYFDSGDGDATGEWANRLDIFGNLQLSGTERILIGVSPLRRDGAFSGYRFKPDDQSGFDNQLNSRITTLFFEGEFGEIFPNLDPMDKGSFDLGFAVGRQPIFFQEGLMINDTIDSIGINRDTIQIKDLFVDMRATFLFGWRDLHRDNNRVDQGALIYGLFTETDFRRSTVNFDFAYVDGSDRTGGDGIYIGASAIQRIGLINTALRAVGSVALERETAGVSNGVVLFGETSYTLPYSHDLVYLNVFSAIDQFSSAARAPTAGGPLGRAGILFEGAGLGRFSSALSNRADDVVGGAIGFQKFWNQDRTQVLLELGGRYGTKDEIKDAVALGLRFQQAIGDRFVWQSNAFGVLQEGQNEAFGIRTEWITRF